VDVTSSSALHVGFGDNSVRIWCDDAVVRRLLDAHFRHCRVATGAAVAEYCVDLCGDGLYRLQCADELLYRGPLPVHLVQALMQNLTEALTAHCRGPLVLHAAGLARAQEGLILCGESGSGKSTLAARLTASGFDFLTDELVAVSPDSRSMSGLARPINLEPGAAFIWQQYVAESERERLPRLDDGTVLLDPDLLRAGCVRAAAAPRFLLFPRYTPDAPFAAQRLSPAEALFVLLQRLINAPNLPDRGFTAARRLAHQTVACRLTYSDVNAAAAWVEQLLSSTGSPRAGALATRSTRYPPD
jgi:hypothetical protein